MTTLNACAEYWSCNGLYAVEELKSYNIIDKNALEKWTADGYITRRDAFETAVKIRDPYSAYIILDKERRSLEELKDMVDYAMESYQYSDYKLQFLDVDYQNEDYRLLSALIVTYMIKGDSEDGETKARFDDNLTVREAVVIASRIPEVYSVASWGFNDDILQEKYNSDCPAFDYLEDMRIINNTIVSDPGCPKISKEDFDKPISADKFFILMYRMLYAPSCAADSELNSDTTTHKLDWRAKYNNVFD